jgi:uncharacterized membrane protein YGL010W
MKTLTDHLSEYAAYHRDRRNIATHFIGIPMIVVGVAVLLCGWSVSLGSVDISLGFIAFVATGIFYMRLDLRFGLVMTLLIGLSIAFGTYIASLPLAIWLSWGLGLFVIGWVLQFIGHFWEGKKPAFVDDMLGLIIGPLFVVAEWSFLLGLRKPLLAAIEARVGPTKIRHPDAATQKS